MEGTTWIVTSFMHPTWLSVSSVCFVSQLIVLCQSSQCALSVISVCFVSLVSVLCQSGQCALSVSSVCFVSQLRVLCQSAPCALSVSSVCFVSQLSVQFSCCRAVSVALHWPRKKTTIIIDISIPLVVGQLGVQLLHVVQLFVGLWCGQENILSSSSAASYTLPGCRSARCATPSCC